MRGKIGIVVGCAVALLCFGVFAEAGCLLSWDRPTTFSDGTPLPAGEALSYRVYVSKTAGGYTKGAFAAETAGTSYDLFLVASLPRSGFTTVTAVDVASGGESGYAAEIPFACSVPSAPANLRLQ